MQVAGWKPGDDDVQWNLCHHVLLIQTHPLMEMARQWVRKSGSQNGVFALRESPSIPEVAAKY